MIIQCEKCKTKFNVDESLLKKEGSRVRCSLCKHTFLAHPPEQLFAEEGETVATDQEELGGDVATATAFSAQKRPAKRRLLPIFLVIILVLIGSVAAIVLWAPRLIPDSLSILKPAGKQEPTDIGGHQLSFQDVTASFVDSVKEVPLFVIKGMVSNNYSGSRSFILIRGSILDDKGHVVKTKLAYAGNTFEEGELTVKPLEDINEAMKNRYGMAGGNFNVAPEANIPFMIVFENLPENVSEFTVETISSSPGT